MNIICVYWRNWYTVTPPAGVWPSRPTFSSPCWTSTHRLLNYPSVWWSDRYSVPDTASWKTSTEGLFLYCLVVIVKTSTESLFLCCLVVIVKTSTESLFLCCLVVIAKTSTESLFLYCLVVIVKTSTEGLFLYCLVVIVKTSTESLFFVLSCGDC